MSSPPFIKQSIEMKKDAVQKQSNIIKKATPVAKNQQKKNDKKKASGSGKLDQKIFVKSAETVAYTSRRLHQSKIMKHRDAKYSFLNGNNGEFTNTDDVEQYYTICATLLSEYDYTLYIKCKLDKETYRKDCYCGCYSYALCVPVTSIQDSKSLRTFEFLNGINGEATNSDDVKGDGISVNSDKSSKDNVDLADLQRHRREAKNHLHQKGFSSTKVLNGPPPICKHWESKGFCNRIGTCKFLHPSCKDPSGGEPALQSKDPVLLPPPPPPSHERQSKAPVWELDGVQFSLKGKDFEVAHSDNPIILPIEEISMQSFVMFGRKFEGGRLKVSPYLYEFLRSRLDVLGDESRNYVAIHNFIGKKLLLFPSTIVEPTVQFYAYKMRQIAQSTVVPSDVPRAFGIPVNTLRPVCRPTTYAPPLDPYAFNDAWTIVDSKGFVMTKTEVPGLDALVSCQFLTNVAITETDRNYYNYFEFTPRHAFQVYEPNGINMCGALSRYFKSPYPDEPDYNRRARQVHVLDGIPLHCVEEVSKLCDAKVKSSFFGNSLAEVTTRKGTIFHINRDESPTIAFINRHFDAVLGVMWLVRFCLCMLDVFGVTWNVLILSLYSPIFYLHEYSKLLRDLVLLPHPKRLLYQTYVINAKILYKILENSGEFESKFKWEFGKVGKQGRLYATGSHLPLAEFFFSTFFKWYFKRRVVIGSFPYKGAIFEVMCEYAESQERSAADTLFSRINDQPNNSLCVYYFSDDGFIVLHIDGEFKIFETDFSSMDSSNGFALFVLLYYFAYVFGIEEGMKRLLAQAARNTRLYNPDSTKRFREYVVLQPETFAEYSGWSLTTVINNAAQLVNVCTLYGKLKDDVKSRDFDIYKSLDEVYLQEVAHSVGYKLTVNRRHNFNASTFLKRAYNGNCSWLVYGAMLRSLGAVDGKPRAEHFGITKNEFRVSSDGQLAELLLKQAVAGWTNEPNSPVLDALRIRAGLYNETRPYDVSFEDLNERYGTETWEWYSLIEAIEKLKLGDKISLLVLEKIFSVDYGTEVIEEAMREIPTRSQIATLM